jgi:hypothetical protein
MVYPGGTAKIGSSMLNTGSVVKNVLMTTTGWALTWMLRMTGGAMLCALVFVFCPFEWMAAIHGRLGLGQLEYTPLMSYLTRTLSAMYAGTGAILLFLSFDVQRYLPLIRFFGLLAVVGGVGVTILDVAIGLPLFWAASEGPLTVVLGVALTGLARMICGRAAV